LEDACKSVQCNGDYTCRIIQRECYPGEPCIPGPECVPRGEEWPPRKPWQGEGGWVPPFSNGANPPNTNCSMVRCSNGTTCQMVLFNPRNCYNSFCTYTERPLCVRQSTLPPLPQNPTGNHPTNASTVPTQCGENEMYTNCVPDCQTNCRGVPECSTGIRVCHAGCVCKDGYRRNGKGQCVMTKYCYQDPGCKAHESWTKCATCETKCFGDSVKSVRSDHTQRGRDAEEAALQRVGEGMRAVYRGKK
ncbi:unnamed protein product, partial [Nippostrongylus brasiliensis]|uniref:TIL domain-containing protein n=1 Tax=Nippostrongylus brasiliensis TaxID=27835 RepID=A0A0N4YNZ2_NIPBR